eukprot:scaffold57098_cov68-Phaeocystis_antarctica.AAC.1
MPGGHEGDGGGGGGSGGTPATPRRVNVHPHLHGRRHVARIQLDVLPERAARVVPCGRLRIAVSQHSVAVPSGRTAFGLDVRPVDEERVTPALHDKIPVPVGTGVRRLEQDHSRDGVVKRGRVRPLQQEIAARVAIRVLIGGRVPIDGADERGVADASGPIERELSVH